MLEKQASLEKEVQVLNKQLLDLQSHVIPQSVKVPVPIEPETFTTKQTSVEKVTKPDESNEESASSSDSSQDSHSTVRSTYSRRRANDPHPPGFRSLSGRIEKFSGCQGDADFELWVMEPQPTVAGMIYSVPNGSRGFLVDLPRPRGKGLLQQKISLHGLG